MLLCRPCFPPASDDITHDGACNCTAKGGWCKGISGNGQYPKLKLTYFDVPGRAEKIRLTLRLARIPFEDKRISQAEWPQLKNSTPLKHLPILEIGDEKTVLSESLAILRYVGKLGNLANTSSSWDASLELAVLHACEGIDSKLFAWVFSPPSSQREVADTLWEETLAPGLVQLEMFIKTSFKGEAAVGDKFSVADIAIYQCVEGFEPFPRDVKQFLQASCPTLAKVVTTVEKKIGQLPKK